jgi:hypothetical protein
VLELNITDGDAPPSVSGVDKEGRGEEDGIGITAVSDAFV